MTTSITLEAAQAQLSNLIHNLGPSTEVEITENGVAVAKIVPVMPTPAPRKVPKLGTQRGSVLSMEHFDDPLDDFVEYM